MEKSNTEILKDLIKYSNIDEVKHVEDISYFEELIFKVGMLGEKKANYTFEKRLDAFSSSRRKSGILRQRKNKF